MADYTYGMVTLNNGDKFRARRDEETGKIAYMGHRGKQNASTKIARSFRDGLESAVPPSNRYLFPDEYDNENMSQANSHSTAWKLH